MTEERVNWRMERSSTGLLFLSAGVPIIRTDVHLCNKLHTHSALGAIESSHCVRIRPSRDH